MAIDDSGLGIPIPPDGTKVHEFPKVVRDGLNKVAALLTTELEATIGPTVSATAAAAVDAEIAAEDLVRATDPGIPSETAPSPEWVDVVTDRTGRISEGTRPTGAKYIGAAEIGTADITDAEIGGATLAGARIEPQLGLSDYPLPVTDSSGRIAEPFAFGTDGRMAQWVLDAWAQRMNIGGTPEQALASWGDSMTALGKDTADSYSAVIATELGISAYNGGASGQTSTEIAMRQGGLDVWLTVQDNALPAAPAWHPVTAVQPVGVWRGFTVHGTLAGIPGTLDLTIAGVWTFRRDTAAATPTPVKPESPFIATEGGPYRNRAQIFRVGRNLPDIDAILRDLSAMRSRLADPHRYLVLPVFNMSTEPSGSAGYADIAAINTAIAAEHGGNFYDLRGYMIRHGLADAGITPTADDTAAIAQDRLPPSLMADTTHLTPAGRIVEGKRLAVVLTSKGLITP